MEQTLKHRPVRDPAFTYSDVERVIQEWLRKTNIFERVVKTAQHARNRAEREQLRRLLDKHLLPDDYEQSGS